MRILTNLGTAAVLGWALLGGTTVRAQNYTDSVVIVLDASGSMKGSLRGTSLNKMEAAKQALKEVLKLLPPSTHVGLLVFSAGNVKNDWLYPLGPRDDAELMKAIDRPNPGHGTPLGKYIKIGADRLLEKRAKQFGYGTYRLLVVTDGEAGDRQLVERYTPDVMARGITMDVIGVAMSQAHTLATKVHSYRAANDAAALKRALAEVFAEVSSTTSDVESAETFASIAPLPTEVAAAMINALANSGNHPIGQRPQAAAASARAAPAPHAAPPTPHPSTGSAARPMLWILGALVFMGFVGLIILWGLIKFVKRMNR